MRPLSTTELTEARRVFGDGLNYGRVRLVETSRLPTLVADIGARLHARQPPPENAVTLGDRSYFPRPLRTEALDLADMAWLIHELTHQWQFQTVGWRYLREALYVQLTLGPAAYDYAGRGRRPQEALMAASRAGRTLADFNREQQGDIARDYYVALRRGDDAAAWVPFVAALRWP